MLSRLENQVQVAGPNGETGEFRILTTIVKPKSQRSIEAYGSCHVVRCQSYGID
jgi:hypothetical protein